MFGVGGRRASSEVLMESPSKRARGNTESTSEPSKPFSFAKAFLSAPWSQSDKPSIEERLAALEKKQQQVEAKVAAIETVADSGCSPMEA